jgi:hypothetical protein
MPASDKEDFNLSTVGARAMKPGFSGEDAIELGFQISLAVRGGRVAVGLEITVELPDGGTHSGLGSAALIRGGVGLVKQALGMNWHEPCRSALNSRRRR